MVKVLETNWFLSKGPSGVNSDPSRPFVVGNLRIMLKMEEKSGFGGEREASWAATQIYLVSTKSASQAACFHQVVFCQVSHTRTASEKMFENSMALSRLFWHFWGKMAGKEKRLGDLVATIASSASRSIFLVVFGGDKCFTYTHVEPKKDHLIHVCIWWVLGFLGFCIACVLRERVPTVGGFFLFHFGLVTWKPVYMRDPTRLLAWPAVRSYALLLLVDPLAIFFFFFFG